MKPLRHVGLLLALVGGVCRAAPGVMDAPCPANAVVRTHEALALALAEGPSELWVSGRIVGDFRLTRPLALHGCEGGTLEGSGAGTVLTVEADDVLIENLHLTRSGVRPTTEDGALKMKGHRNVVRHVTADDSLYGIGFEGCQACTLEDSFVRGRNIEENLRGDGVKLWEAHGSIVRRNRVENVRDVVVWYSRHVTLEDNVITGGRYGTHFMYAHDSIVRRSQLRDNVVGVFFMYSNRCTAEDNVLAGARGSAGMGVGFKESDSATLKRNLIVANTTGVYLDRTPFSPEARVDFEENSLVLNGVGVRFHNSEKAAYFVKNDFKDNDVLVEVDGGGDAMGVTFSGNSFSDYAGYDLDKDGTGDVPFVVTRSSTQLADAHPTLRYFQGTAAIALYDAISKAMPYMGSQKLLEDLKPAMRMHREVPR